jgi:hypothetical protein
MVILSFGSSKPTRLKMNIKKQVLNVYSKMRSKTLATALEFEDSRILV